MTAQIKAEFKKLFTVRSTYILTLIVWLVILGIAFFIGFHDSPNDLANPQLMQDSIFGSLRFAGLIAAIISILLLAHEYRYNTINFSLTLNPKRSGVLAAKFVVLTGYSIVLSMVAVAVVIGGLNAGAAAHSHVIGTQVYDVIGASGSQALGILLQSAFYVWAMAIAGLIITGLLRNLVASIAFIFIFPSLENLVTLISKTVVKYLPFSDLGAVLKIDPHEAGFSAGKSMIIFLIYLVVFGFISWRLFLKRDAN